MNPQDQASTAEQQAVAQQQATLDPQQAAQAASEPPSSRAAASANSEQLERLQQLAQYLQKQSTLPSHGKTWVTARDAEIIRPGGRVTQGDASKPGMEPPMTVMEMLDRTVAANANSPAMFSRVGHGDYSSITWQSVHDQVKAVARSLIVAGLKPHQSVNVMGHNSPEWVIGYLGCIYAGGIAAGLYNQISESVCHYQAEHSEAVVAIVGSPTALRKILSVKPHLPGLRAIVCYGQNTVLPEAEYTRANAPRVSTIQPSQQGFLGVINWADFLRVGANHNVEPIFQERLRNQKPGCCAALVYTPGSVGNPKAVMLSHDNLTWSATAVFDKFLMTNAKSKTLGLLPLAYHLSLSYYVFGPAATGMQVYFENLDDANSTLVESLVRVKPTVFLGFPDTWQAIRDQATRLIPPGSSRTLEAARTPKLATKVGLDECTFCASSGWAMELPDLDFFAQINISINEVYGSAECTGMATLNTAGCYRVGSCGRAIRGSEVALFKRKDAVVGELLVRGPHVFMGYLMNPSATRDVVDDNSYLHSGDMASTDQGFITLLGAGRDFLTVDGRQVLPWTIERTIKEELPMVSRCVVMGDQTPFFTCLLTLKTKPNSDVLVDEIVEKCRVLGFSASKVADATANEQFQTLLNDGIIKTNERHKALNIGPVKKFAILPSELTIENSELSFTRKVRRRNVLHRYSQILETLYGSNFVKPNFGKDPHPMITHAALAALRANLSGPPPVAPPVPPGSAQDTTTFALAADSNGKQMQIMPAVVEASLIKHIPAVRHAMVVGENRPGLACLVTIKTQPGNDHTLSQETIAAARAFGSTAATIEDATKNDPNFRKFLIDGMTKANWEAPSPQHVVRKFVIIPAQFTEASGELLPNGHLNRPVITQKYSQVIDGMFHDPDAERRQREAEETARRRKEDEERQAHEAQLQQEQQRAALAAAEAEAAKRRQELEDMEAKQRAMQEEALRRAAEAPAELCGVGVVLHPNEAGLVTVKQFVQGGSADLSGELHVGDILYEVAHTPVYNKSGAEITKLILGPPGTQVPITVKRGRAGEFVQVTLTRMPGLKAQTVTRRDLDQVLSHSPVASSPASAAAVVAASPVVKHRKLQMSNRTAHSVVATFTENGLSLSSFTVAPERVYPDYSTFVPIPDNTHTALVVEFANDSVSRRVYNVPAFDMRDWVVTVTYDDTGAAPQLVPQIKPDGMPIPNNMDTFTLKINCVTPSTTSPLQSAQLSSLGLTTPQRSSHAGALGEDSGYM